jgi:hypothetical protein
LNFLSSIFFFHRNFLHLLHFLLCFFISIFFVILIRYRWVILGLNLYRVFKLCRLQSNPKQNYYGFLLALPVIVVHPWDFLFIPIAIWKTRVINGQISENTVCMLHSEIFGRHFRCLHSELVGNKKNCLPSS